MNIRTVRIDEIHTDPTNARRHGEKNLDAIGASIRTFGQVEPLVIQKSSGRVIGGNGRLEVLRRGGAAECDVVEVDLDDTQARALSLALNRTSELAEWDDDALASALSYLKLENVDLGSLGFDDVDLSELLDMPEVIEDEIPEPPDEAVTRPGDLIVLGNHRLLCGDAGSTVDVDRLLAGNPIHLCNCDPPYNVRVEPRSNNAIAAGMSSFPASEARRHGGLKHHQAFDVARQGAKKATHARLRAKDRPLANDFVSDDEFARLLRAWFGQIGRVLLPGRAAYIWGGYANCANYPAALKEAGLYFSQAI
ncbi:MAG: ParB N-terminal domain-containing protein, partial [Phycisphaerales bacterium]|nr:ParB N-terminal domain-containing protein [Phycisphaerales bacterium]